MNSEEQAKIDRLNERMGRFYARASRLAVAATAVLVTVVGYYGVHAGWVNALPYAIMALMPLCVPTGRKKFRVEFQKNLQQRRERPPTL